MDISAGVMVFLTIGLVMAVGAMAAIIAQLAAVMHRMDLIIEALARLEHPLMVAPPGLTVNPFPSPDQDHLPDSPFSRTDR